MAVGGDEMGVAADLAVGELDVPAAVGAGLGGLDADAEGDGVLEAAVPGEGADVVERLDAVGIVGVLVGKGVIVEPRERLRGDEVRRLVHRAAGVLDVPDAADGVVALDHLVLDAGALEGVGGGEARGARADDPDGRGVRERARLVRHLPPRASALGLADRVRRLSLVSVSGRRTTPTMRRKGP